jgi:hypothetical protein
MLFSSSHNKIKELNEININDDTAIKRKRSFKCFGSMSIYNGKTTLNMSRQEISNANEVLWKLRKLLSQKSKKAHI